jgi:hypothetical protein
MFSVVTDFDKLRVERFKQATEEKLRDVRCPEHHQPPRLRFHGTSLRDITISLSGCCSKLMEIANARIGSPWLGKGLSDRLGEAGSAKAS